MIATGFNQSDNHLPPLLLPPPPSHHESQERMTGMTTDVLETAAAQGSLILAEGARRYIEYSSLVAALTAIANGHGSYSRDLADEFKPGQYGSPVRNPMEVYNDGRRFTGSQLDDIVAWVIQKRGSKKGEPLIPKTVPGRKKANGNGTDVDKTSTWLNATRFCHGLVDEIRRNRSVDERNKAQRIIDHYASLVNQNDGHLLAAVSGLIDDTHGAPVRLFFFFFFFCNSPLRPLCLLSLQSLPVQQRIAPTQMRSVDTVWPFRGHF